MARVVAFLMVTVAVTACSHRAVREDDQVAKMSEFRMSKEDVIEVSVWKEPELSRTVPIRPDGKITLPLLGDVQAEGLKPQELEQKVAQSLTPYVRDPHVTVIVHDVNGAKVFVTGMVTHPGVFPLRNSMGLLQALAMAGGLAEFADRGDIKVLHADGRHVEVDYDSLVSGESRVFLGPGDTVVVP
ncbi:MAG: polysaccharide biosynthesis/export family protein [Myxococcales bacterium]|nr:polysaccharide biosynthesis/export family protein [Myxococcales bacterium]